MFTEPKHGWVILKLGDFEGSVSYLTDVPIDCLDAFIYALRTNNPATIFFDAEGWDFHLVSSYYDGYIISDKNEPPELYLINNGTFRTLAKELISDIEKYFDEWVNWLSYEDLGKEELRSRKYNLIYKKNVLKNLIEEK